MDEDAGAPVVPETHNVPVSASGQSVPEAESDLIVTDSEYDSADDELLDDEGQLPIEGISDLFANNSHPRVSDNSHPRVTDNSHPRVTAPDRSETLTSELDSQNTQNNVRVSSRGRRVKPNPRFHDYVMDE